MSRHFLLRFPSVSPHTSWNLWRETQNSCAHLLHSPVMRRPFKSLRIEDCSLFWNSEWGSCLEIVSMYETWLTYHLGGHLGCWAGNSLSMACEVGYGNDELGYTAVRNAPQAPGGLKQQFVFTHAVFSSRGSAHHGHSGSLVTHGHSAHHGHLGAPAEGPGGTEAPPLRGLWSWGRGRRIWWTTDWPLKLLSRSLHFLMPKKSHGHASAWHHIGWHSLQQYSLQQTAPSQGWLEARGREGSEHFTHHRTATGFLWHVWQGKKTSFLARWGKG